MAFAEVLGHERLKELLARAVARGRVPPALLFSGPEGVGKKALALVLARTLLCERAAPEACGACTHCRRLARAMEHVPAQRREALEQPDEPSRLNLRLHPDLLLVEAWRTGIKIEQVREAAREIGGLPFEARARVAIFDDAHLMTEPAANSLLKSLEEPPASSHIVLVTHAPQALLPTIRSRCQVLRFNRLPTPLLERHLASRGLGAAEAHLRAALATGSLGAALAFESEAYRALRDDLLGLLEAAQRASPLERMEAAERLAEQDDPVLALTTLRSLLRDVAVLAAGAGAALVLNADALERLSALARGRLGRSAAAAAEAAGEAGLALRANANKLLTFDVLLDGLVPAG
jgi:DNA polymerase-3 subunit delta'